MCSNCNLYRDLLSDGGFDEVLDIKMAQDGSVYVPGLTWKLVNTLDDVSKVFDVALTLLLSNN